LSVDSSELVLTAPGYEPTSYTWLLSDGFLTLVGPDGTTTEYVRS
jgi:hypothetical protein